jgi:hypothetical protein
VRLLVVEVTHPLAELLKSSWNNACPGRVGGAGKLHAASAVATVRINMIRVKTFFTMLNIKLMRRIVAQL